MGQTPAKNVYSKAIRLSKIRSVAVDVDLADIAEARMNALQKALQTAPDERTPAQEIDLALFREELMEQFQKAEPKAGRAFGVAEPKEEVAFVDFVKIAEARIKGLTDLSMAKTAAKPAELTITDLTKSRKAAVQEVKKSMM